MSKRIDILGAVLMSIDGTRITGDLGIEKDVDIVSAMFTVVSQFVEDTFDKPADQIKLGELFLTKVEGDTIVIWVTSTGTSEGLVNGIQTFLTRMEEAHGAQLADWDGLVEASLERDFTYHLNELRSIAGREERVYVPELGFDLLKKENVQDYVESIEDAYNLYFISGDQESALHLAKSTAETLEAQDPDTPYSSLFYALAAKVLVLKRENFTACNELLERAFDKSLAQKNFTAQAETADAYAHYYSLNEDHRKSRMHSREALELIEGADMEDPRNFNRKVNFALTDIITYVYEDRYDSAVEGWKRLGDALDRMIDPETVSDVHRLMLSRHRISINNNIGFVTTMKNRSDPGLYKEALPYFEAALESAQETDARWYYPIIMGNLGIAHAFLGDFDRAREYISSGYKTAKGLKNEYRIAVVERDWGVFHYRKGMSEASADDLYEAMHWFNRAVSKQTSKGEIEYINYFKSECEMAIRDLLI